MTIFIIVWLVASFVALGIVAVLRPQRHWTWLVVILSLTTFAVWVSLPDNPGIRFDMNRDGLYEIDRPIAVRQGLDLAGGVKILMEANMPEGVDVDRSAMNEVRRIVEDRIDALGALEPVVQLQGEKRLIIELPGYEDPESAVDLVQQTALLEFVALPSPLPPGTPVDTDYRQQQTEESEPASDEQVEEEEEPGLVYTTVMTGEALQTADVGFDPNTGEPIVQLVFTPEGGRIFGTYTAAHQGEILGIVLDGRVISSPQIGAVITSGRAVIEGNFDLETARRLATQLRYGALPIPLRVDSTSTVGPTLGQISVEQSIRAGLIGIVVVIVFMLIYYRVPGIAAALALVIFALLNFAIYKLVPVTMTLPAITGFLISVGTAVDGNILIFERLKEELRSGKRIDVSMRAGFERAWTSIRDSNFSTIIICVVLYAFGTSFGAGAVRGFAVTLALGLVINLFTAVTVTRTFLHFILMPVSEQTLDRRPWLLGL